MASIKGRFAVTAGTAAEFLPVKASLILKKGEFAWETDTQQVTVGDGVAKFENLTHYKLGAASFEPIVAIPTASEYVPALVDRGKVIEFTANGKLKINSGVFSAGDYFEFTWVSGPQVELTGTATGIPSALKKLRVIGSSGAVRFRSGSEYVATGDFE